MVNLTEPGGVWGAAIKESFDLGRRNRKNLRASGRDVFGHIKDSKKDPWSSREEEAWKTCPIGAAHSRELVLRPRPKKRAKVEPFTEPPRSQWVKAGKLVRRRRGEKSADIKGSDCPLRQRQPYRHHEEPRSKEPRPSRRERSFNRARL